MLIIFAHYYGYGLRDVLCLCFFFSVDQTLLCYYYTVEINICHAWCNGAPYVCLHCIVQLNENPLVEIVKPMVNGGTEGSNLRVMLET